MKRKVKELAMKLYEDAHKHFPAIHFVNIQEHPEQANRYWINVAGELSEDQQEEMRMFVGRKATNILIKEGYSFAIMLDNTMLEAVQ
jgi:NAD+--asparagine ADP-ribosyltransferase